MTTLPDTVDVELRVALPRGREFVVREEAPALQLEGGDESTALVLIGRASRAAISRYMHDAESAFALFDSLARAAGIAPAAGEPVNAAESADDAARRFAAALEAVSNALAAHGVDHPAGDPAVGVRQLVDEIENQAASTGVDADTALGRVHALGWLARATRDGHRLARIVSAARDALEHAGVPAADAGDEQLAAAITQLAENRTTAAANLRSTLADATIERGAELARQVTDLQARLARTTIERDAYAAAIAGAAGRINATELLAGVRPGETLELPAAVDLLLGELSQVTGTARRQQAELNAAATTIRAYEHALTAAAVPTTPHGVRILIRQAANAKDDAKGLRRQLERANAGARRWANLLRALDGAGRDERLPHTVRSSLGSPLFRIAAPNDAGSLSIFPAGDDSGMRLGGRDARALFLAAVRSLFPPADVDDSATTDPAAGRGPGDTTDVTGFGTFRSHPNGPSA